jgi:hypothetical protein
VNDPYPHPSDVKIDRWRRECWYLISPFGDQAEQPGHQIVDLLWFDSYDQVRSRIRVGHIAVPQDAGDFLIRCSEACICPGWGRAGVFYRLPGSLDAVRLSSHSDEEVNAALRAGAELLRYDQVLTGLPPAPSALMRSWEHVRIEARASAR